MVFLAIIHARQDLITSNDYFTQTSLCLSDAPEKVRN